MIGNDPETFKYKADILTFYPSISEGAAINTLKLLFPNGCEIRTEAKKPILQSCYIAVSDSSLDVHMLTFIKYYEKASLAFCENVTSILLVFQKQL